MPADCRGGERWGFRWVGELIWDKEVLGVGRWFRGRTEVLVVAERTEVLALGVKNNLKVLSDCVDPVVRIRRARHSEKPEQFQEFVEKLSPGPRVELFARRGRKGWDRWGWETARE